MTSLFGLRRLSLRSALYISALAAFSFGCSKGSEAAPQKDEKPAASEAKAEAAAPAEHPGLKDPSKAKEQAPAQFTIAFDTTQGEVLVDVTRDWSPNGADRIYNLVKVGYYNEVAFFRVIEGFMAQVGISGDPALNNVWRPSPIPDDPVKESNKRGYVTFAKTGAPNSRTTQIFFNFSDNVSLDQMGFAPFGKVRDMANLDKLYKGYGEGAPRGRGPEQGRVQQEGNSYLKKDFPKLDYIKSARIVSP